MDKTVPVIKDIQKDNSNLPEAIFFESAEDYVEEYGYEKVINALKNAQNKYRFTENQFSQF